MSLFKKDLSVQESKEFSKGFNVLPTAAYKGIIKQAYVQLVQGKNGHNFNMNWKLELDVNGNKTERSFNNIFIAKMVNGSPMYFMTTQDGKKEYPSFSALNRHLSALLDKSLFDEGVLVEKTLPVYNFQTKKDEPTAVYSIDGVIGMEAVFGIMENHENGYKDPSKVVKSNTIERVWKLVDGIPFSGTELKAGLTTPQNFNGWVKDYAGQVNDKVDKDKLSGSVSASGTTALDLSAIG